MNRICACSLLAAVALTLAGWRAAQAAELTYAPDFRAGVRAGPGELRIEEGQRIGEQVVGADATEHTVGVGGTFEYRAPFGLVVEAGLFMAGSADLFDSGDYRLTEYFGSVGYEIPLSASFTVTPRVGRTRWKLAADYLWFVGDEEASPTTRGFQTYWEITALKRINETVALGISHRENSYDFGRARSTVFTAMFKL